MAKSEIEVTMRNNFAGLLVAQGVLAVLFGIAALFWPGLTAALFVGLFGLFALVWGLIVLVGSFLGAGRKALWWLETVFAVLLVGLGVYLLRNPEVTVAVIILLVGFTLIIKGLTDLLTGLFSKDTEVVENRWLVMVGGVLGLVLGVVVLAHPVATGLVFVWALGLYAVLYGALTVALAFRVRE
jgi:uncharacterized membrane protein HdeD (DUF308 family)